MSEMAGALSLAIFAVASFIWGIVTTGAWVVQSFLLRCKASKLLDKASRGSLTIAFIFKSNHVTKITPCRVHPNGYLETLSTSKTDPKHYIPILRTTFSRTTIDVGRDDPNVEAEENLAIKEASDVAQIEKQILTPTAIEGTNCRAYLVYDGVACAVTAEALVGLGFDSQHLTYEVGQKYKAFLNIVLNINPQLVKKYLTKLYDQSTVDGYGQDMWQAGFNTAKKGSESLNKLVLLGGIAIGICGMIGGIVLSMLS